MLKEKLVLLVDDEPGTRRATRVGLSLRGFTVREADSADDALKAIAQSRPSIVVSDLVMPVTNGFELFEKVKQQQESKSIPFVFLTAVDDYYAKKFGTELGGAAYITKPVDLDELEQIIRDKIGE